MRDLSSRTRDAEGRLCRETRFSPVDKRCSECQETKPIGDFSTDSRKRDGRKSACKVCLAAKERSRHASNPDRSRTYDASRREQRNGRLRAKRVADPAWAARQRRIVARYHELKRCGITIDLLFDRDRGICHICEEAVEITDAQMDHVIPLSRGGSHDPMNVKLAHGRCNARKRDKLLSEL